MDSSMGGSGEGLMYWGTALITVIPTLAAGVRRLHDVNKSGWWLLIYFTGIGSILIFIWSVIEGTKNDNEYGKST